LSSVDEGAAITFTLTTTSFRADQWHLWLLPQPPQPQPPPLLLPQALLRWLPTTAWPEAAAAAPAVAAKWRLTDAAALDSAMLLRHLHTTQELPSSMSVSAAMLQLRQPPATVSDTLQLPPHLPWPLLLLLLLLLLQLLLLSRLWAQAGLQVMLIAS
jgi:hypothetical protein